MVRRNRNPPAEQKPEEKDEEERTEFRGEYRGGKFSLFIGRHGTVVAWAISFLMFVIGVSILAATVVSVLEKIGQSK